MSQSILHNGSFKTPTKQILHSGVWQAVSRAILHGGAWNQDSQFVQVYSGSHFPPDYSMTASGSTGVKSSWWKFEVPGKPIGFKVHIIDTYVAGNAYRPEFKAMVAAAASPLVDTVANAWHPVGGNAVSATGWNKVKWGGADSVLAKDSAASAWGNSSHEEMVSDLIPITNMIQQPNGNSYALLCVEQMTANAPYLQWGAYLARNYLQPLASEDGVINGTYWHDIYTNGTSTQAVTNAPLTAPAIPTSSAGGQGICAWLEPVYDKPVRSFLSTGDSTFSCAYAYQNYAGWIGNAVRAFNDPSNDKIFTYKHCGASGNSLANYMRFFNQELDNCTYSDVVIQGWSQNDWQAGNNADLWISTITAAVNRCKALGIRVFLADGYVISVSVTPPEPFVRVFNAINALCDGVSVIKLNSWELITDTTAAGAPHANYNGGDNVHASLVGQNVLKERLKTLISATL